MGVLALSPFTRLLIYAAMFASAFAYGYFKGALSESGKYHELVGEIAATSVSLKAKTADANTSRKEEKKVAGAFYGSLKLRIADEIKASPSPAECVFDSVSVNALIDGANGSSGGVHDAAEEPNPPAPEGKP